MSSRRRFSIIIGHCKECEKPIYRKPYMVNVAKKKLRKREFCGKSCAAKARNRSKTWRKKVLTEKRKSAIGRTQHKRFVKDPKLAKAISKRMTEHNPMHDPEIVQKQIAHRTKS